LFTATAKIFASKRDFAKMDGEKDGNQSSAAELSCFMCWRSRVPLRGRGMSRGLCLPRRSAGCRDGAGEHLPV